MDDYGLIAKGKLSKLGNRHFRCMFAVARVGNTRFETYVFPSQLEAADFEDLMGDGDPTWLRRKNLVFHALAADPDALDGILNRTIENQSDQD